MATGKRYYWMKLKESFMTSDTIDYFMSQPDGANYVVLYQMLCLKTIHTDGRLSRQIGEVIIPYDVEKIRRDCKWFSADTIRVALKLFQSFGLIYVDVDGTLVLADHNNLVGSETDAAARMRSSRASRSNALPECATDGEQCSNNVTPDNRDKSLDCRDKDIQSSDDRGREDKKKADAFAAFAGDDDELLAALRDFAKMRKSIKKPLTDEAAKRLLSKLQKDFPREDWVPVINQSVDHCWQGLFPLKDGAAQSQRNYRNAAKTQRTAMDDLRDLHAIFEAEEESL